MRKPTKKQGPLYRKDPVLTMSDSPHSPHMIIPDLIPAKSFVLDVGCNAGYLAKTLLKKKCITDGIDINETALLQAKLYCRSVYRRDLYQPSLDIPSRTYDYIVFSDILEHLPRPDQILVSVKHYLKPGGYVIASIPNIARIELRIRHLWGDFTYAPGIMSPDHLRFFTRDSAIKLFQHAGYTVKRIIPTGLGHMIGILPTLTAFQFVIVAKIHIE